ncbi:protein of unknown function [Flavobacterium swingsii]|jgi:hypothetical protein|uniref:Transglutaminase-like superfamily protein n=1 Tax=Flavobacterium swingsii TaxID=498292 RepID=A0A1I0XV42_9FLAO|nr:DUF3857 domain-containing protein [Flavobacterium swingsii]SFB04160.1 protein of unknown function [Flavobacterium swingsii]
MSIKKIFILGLLITFSNIYAQKFELGKVTIAELQEKTHPKDTTAVAAILYNVGRTYFEYSQNDGFIMITEVTTRVKIYKKEGYEWANKAVSFYVGNSPEESVDFSKAVTYNLVNGAIEKTKLKSEGEFVEKTNKYYSTKKITMPNVKVGSVIEYKYELKSKYFSKFPDWDFQEQILVNYSEYKTVIPEYFLYNTYRKGSLKPLETKTSSKISITLTSKELGFGGYKKDSETINYTNSIVTYLSENIPAIKDEVYVNNIENYSSSVKHELSATKFPNDYTKAISQTWEDVVKTIYESDEFGGELNKSNYFEEDLKAILAGLTTQEEKTNAIFNFVQSRMNWNDYNGYRCDDGVKKAYKDKKGNIAEINIMLVAMLRYADIKSNPVLLSTRSNGIPVYPSITGFNYVVAAVESDKGLILLDASNKNTTPNILPMKALNWFGKIIRKNNTSEDIDLMPKQNSKSVINLFVNINVDASIDGRIQEQYFDYNALNFREKHKILSQENYLEKLEKESNIEVSDYTIANKLDLTKPVIETYSFKRSNSIEKIGDKLYFSPLLFLAETNNPFTQEKREYPIDYGFPSQEKINLNITIPEGYIVESMPEKTAIGISDNLGIFRLNISNTANKIQVIVSTEINTPIFPADYYEELKAFYGSIVKKETEKIVLKKI